MNSHYQRNGESVSRAIASDRALLYGDGIFTSIAVNQGQSLFLEQHLSRLTSDAKKLKIDNIPLSNIKSEIQALAKQQGKGIIRVTLSRSSGERGYHCATAQPVYWFIVSEWPEHIEKCREDGIKVRICDYQLSRNSRLAGIKHCNRLEQVMARNEWSDDSIQEGLVFDTMHNVIEGTMSNLFLIKNNELFTPDLTFAGVNGIIRQQIIQIAEVKNIPTHIGDISSEQLFAADEIFLTNAVIGIWPVTRLEQQRYSEIRLTRLLQQELDKLSVHESESR